MSTVRSAGSDSGSGAVAAACTVSAARGCVASINAGTQRSANAVAAVNTKPAPSKIAPGRSAERVWAPVARAINAAIDGFMRAGGDKPCIRLAALKLELVVDVARDASGGFHVVVPALALDAGAGERRVNTLVLEWAHIESRALR